jgi:hypothetical protein
VVGGAPIGRRYVGMPAGAALGILRRSGARLDFTLDPTDDDEAEGAAELEHLTF